MRGYASQEDSQGFTRVFGRGTFIPPNLGADIPGRGLNTLVYSPVKPVDTSWWNKIGDKAQGAPITLEFVPPGYGITDMSPSGVDPMPGITPISAGETYGQILPAVEPAWKAAIQTQVEPRDANGGVVPVTSVPKQTAGKEGGFSLLGGISAPKLGLIALGLYLVFGRGKR